jgi:hypothetical protein
VKRFSRQQGLGETRILGMKTMTGYRIYCDESCHLQHDSHDFMVLGALWCPEETVNDVSKKIADIQVSHKKNSEVKWQKLSTAQFEFYRDLVDLFFAHQGLNFRALIVTEKSKLDHDAFNQGSHDNFYYKMYYQLLSFLIKPGDQYRIFLDKKDTQSRRKVSDLTTYLRNKAHDFDGNTIKNIQSVHSNEVRLLQLCDVLLGAVAYANEGKFSSEGKSKIAKLMMTKSGCSLTQTTWNPKVNIFRFTPTTME